MDNSTPSITEKEIREVYSNLPKKRLVDILVGHFMENKRRNESYVRKAYPNGRLIG